jgi:hypothetical protein
LVTDGLDVVAVGIEDERPVVVLVVVRSEARRPVVAPSGRDPGGVEGVDRGAVGAKGDVEGPARLAALAEPEVGMSAGLKADVTVELAEHLVAERFERAQVERFRDGDVADVDGDVIEHLHLLGGSVRAIMTRARAA